MPIAVARGVSPTPYSPSNLPLWITLIECGVASLVTAGGLVAVLAWDILTATENAAARVVAAGVGILGVLGIVLIRAGFREKRPTDTFRAALFPGR